MYMATHLRHAYLMMHVHVGRVSFCLNSRYYPYGMSSKMYTLCNVCSTMCFDTVNKMDILKRIFEKVFDPVLIAIKYFNCKSSL